MINPSINGWIDKFLLTENNKSDSEINLDNYYKNLRASGFLFGTIVAFDEKNNLLQTELSKVAYLKALWGIFKIKNNGNTNFVATCNLFFDDLNPHENNLLDKFLPKYSSALTLEKNIDERININENIFSKNFSQLVTNAFLFIDILAFQEYLIKGNIPKDYLKTTEEKIISIITIALKIKSKKSEHDDLLIKLFENSTRYTKFSYAKNLSIEDLNLDFFEQILQKKYILDLASLTLWSDGTLDNNEIYFHQKLGEKLGLNQAFINESITQINDFIFTNKKDIYYFNDLNPVKSFYDSTTKNVKKLIVRNQKRLTKEISQSKELMQLLALSTTRNLDEIEKKKVKKQLLDICKTIPSLTIFLIPGGSLLLPILIKFIPQLLPSSFNENLEED